MNEQQNKSNFSKTFYCFIPVILYFGISSAVYGIYRIVVLADLKWQNPALQNSETTNKIMEYLLAANTQLMLIIAVLTIVVAGYLFIRKEYKAFDRKFQNRIGFKGILASLTITVGFYMFVQICLIIATSVLDLSEVLEDYNESIGYLLSGNSIWDILAIGVLTPIAEELIFRGLAFNRMRLIMKENTAIIASSLLFAFMHMDPIQVSYTLFLGVILAYAYTKYENILVPMLIHMIFNLINFVATEQMLNDILATRAGSLLFYAVCVFLIYVGTRLMTRKTKPSLKL